MKKVLTILMCLVLLLSMTMGAVGCGNGSTGGIQKDESRTQLYIGNYNGGFGGRWLDEYIKKFEAAYANKSFEDGKMGVQVIPLNDKDLFNGGLLKDTFANLSVNLLFTERLDFQYLASQDLLYDITSAVQADIPGEDKSIEDKLSNDQKTYYMVNGKYYGVPHFQAYRGIVYDRDLFDAKKLFIKANGQAAGKSTDTDLSAGPNGVPGDYDDGLPATYSQFFKWCKDIQSRATPICWTGAYKETYTMHLLDALYVDAQGYTEANYRYNLNLSKTPNVTSNLVTGFNGSTPVSSAQPVTSRKDLLKQTGLFNSLDFLYRIIDGKYYYSKSLNIAETHDMIHKDFLESSYSADAKPIACMVEGTWWEEESADIFKSMESMYGEEASRSNRNLAFMPLPKPDGQSAGNPVLFDGNQAVAVVCKTNTTPVQAQLAMEFLKFISSDENLELFHTMVGIGRDYKYTLSQAGYDSLSNYAKSVYDIKQNADGIVYGYALNADNYQWGNQNKVDFYNATINGTTYDGALTAFIAGKNIDSVSYFKALYASAK